jgi:hypothetical protein
MPTTLAISADFKLESITDAEFTEAGTFGFFGVYEHIDLSVIALDKSPALFLVPTFDTSDEHELSRD